MSLVPMLLGVIGLAIGGVIGWLIAGSKLKVVQSQLQNVESRNAELARELTLKNQTLDALQRDVRTLTDHSASQTEKASRIPQLEREIMSKEEYILKQGERINDLQATLQALNERLKNAQQSSEEKIKLLTDARKELEQAFDSLSKRALDSNAQSFLELAQTKLGQFQQAARGDLENRQKAFADFVRPVKESLDNVDKKIGELERSRIGAYESLKEQVESLKGSQALLRGETTNLVRALRDPATRGRWGEVQLQRVLEFAGMIEHVHFEKQTSIATETGQKRPDIIVKLPGGKSIVVDSKVPLDAYWDGVSATEESIRRECMARHAKQLRNHISDLSSKSYWKHLPSSPEYVIMFLVDESSLYRAIESDPELINFGFDKGVMMATPTTLVALLRSVQYGWNQEKLAVNAKEISVLGAELYDRLSTVGGHLSRLGNSIKSSVDNYNKSISSLESRVVPSARRFKELGVSAGDREFPEPKQIETTTIEIQSPELLFEDGGSLE